MVFETKEGVHLFSIVGVKNTGVPSIVERVRLRIIGDKTLSDISPHEIEEGLTYYSPDGKPFIKFDPKDSLYEKLTSVPIERGGARQGWLRFPLSKAHVKDLLGKEFEISLKDITGKDYSVKATIEMQKPDEPVFGVPGIRNPFVKNP